VLPAGSVAVAVMTWPPGMFLLKLSAKLALQALSVVIVVEPRKDLPSPNPEASQDGLEKNSRRKLVLGVLLKAPWIVMAVPEFSDEVIIG
jgi:hypothetical protein